MNVLLVEDDDLLGRTLQRGLVEAGDACEWCQDGAAALTRLKTHRYDAVVLDLMLPGVSGLEILASLRRSGDRVPVLILSALGSVDERVAGLQAGADDYLVKPFAFSELSARLVAITRRAQQQTSTLLSVGPLTLDPTSRQVSRDGEAIDLTPTEFELLAFLMRHAGEVVTRKMLCEHLWSADWEGVTNVIEVHINRLRAKIDRGFDAPLVHTVRGRGYVVRAE